MAVLNDTERKTVWAKLMRKLSTDRSPTGGLSKPELRAAIDATDQWIEDNQASFNTALPPAARNALSQKQKALLFFFVANGRFEVI